MSQEKGYKFEIVPYAFPKDSPTTCEVGIDKMKVTYVQGDDTNHGGKNDIQTLTISTENALCNREQALNGEGYYLVIKTKRWAFRDTNELVQIIEDFKDRLFNGIEKLK